MTGPTTVAAQASEGVSQRTTDGRRCPDRTRGRSARLATRAFRAAVTRRRRRRSSLAACDDDGAGDTEQFCDDVADNVEALRADPATDDDVEDLIDLWRDIGDDAPLAIEEEWDAHADNLELAWTSDDQQEVVASAFAAERSAVAIAGWLERQLRHRLRAR